MLSITVTEFMFLQILLECGCAIEQGNLSLFLNHDQCAGEKHTQFLPRIMELHSELNKIKHSHPIEQVFIEEEGGDAAT